MEDKKTMLETKSISDLRFRLAVLNTIIREAQKAGDERWKEAARQQRVINEVLVRKVKEARQQAGEPEPEPVRIGMKPVYLRSQAPSNTK